MHRSVDLFPPRLSTVQPLYGASDGCFTETDECELWHHSEKCNSSYLSRWMGRSAKEVTGSILLCLQAPPKGEQKNTRMIFIQILILKLNFYLIFPFKLGSIIANL